MNTKFNYFCYENAVPHHICDKIISLINNSKKNLGVIGGTSNDDRKGVNKKIRKSHVAFDDAWWVYRWTHPYIRKGNEDGGWNFEWDQSEPFQLTEYRPGEFYKWHTDQFHIPFGEKESSSVRGKIRKLSAVINISDPKDYTGGELEFDFRDGSPPLICKEIKPRGSIVVFPGFVYHRVKPVVEGTRYSLVCWAQGNAWR